MRDLIAGGQCAEIGLPIRCNKIARRNTSQYRHRDGDTLHVLTHRKIHVLICLVGENYELL
jgi:hypothetical protein